MTSNYKKISDDNRIRRGTEFRDIGRWISEQFYSDSTHFIYELLQNAEDALERRSDNDETRHLSNEVSFRLHENRLEVSHYGHPFIEDDVIGISDILRGTKSLDYKQIGKFGIGFKSIYAFTSSPEVHSGDEHFCIKEYIHPQSAAPIKINPGETLFILPFDHSSITPDIAFKKIKERLSGLGLQTLLFLKYIDQIIWDVNGINKGIYIRETQIIDAGKSRKVSIIGKKGKNSIEQNWLIFEKDVDRPDNGGSTQVEVAYRLGCDNKDKKEKIVGVDGAAVFAYFPTEKETHLRFLIQGHYITTPARDNISVDKEWNLILVDETASLVVESLILLRDMGFMDLDLLLSLPIQNQHFPKDSVFYPMFEKVRAALSENSLLPAHEGGYISAGNAQLARSSELRGLLSEDILSELFGFDKQYRWLIDEISENTTPELRTYLMQELDIEEINPEKFANKITHEFLTNRSDEWIVSFYSFLNSQAALWRKRSYDRNEGVLRTSPIIRLENGSHIIPFDKKGNSNACLPPEE